MPKVNGIGGIFFRTPNHEKLAKWYEEHFGIVSDPNGAPWQQHAGMTVFAPFPQDSDYFPSGQAFMLNFRVDDIDSFVEELKMNGVKVDEKRQNESYGKFAWVYDPEGNKIELWQPIGKE